MSNYLKLFCIAVFACINFIIPANGGLIFQEDFSEDIFLSGKWILSSLSDFVDQPIKLKPSSNPGKGFENDNGLELTQEFKKYALGTKFATPIDTKDKDLVIQYEVKFDDVITCGGAYLKFLRHSDKLDITKLDNGTPYTIMFGPDKCGHETNKVHFILNHQNPLTKKFEEKHFNNAPQIKNDKKTHLYTLHLRKDNTFEIYVDKVSSKKGSLLTDMTPSVNPPKEIDDPEDKKPEDWVEEAKIPDLTATKPADWDESAPLMIDDVNDKKPDGWLDDAPKTIPDPAAKKPDDWDDAEDGDWEAPTIPNPACEAAGCGVWKPAQIKNPAYKGKWKAPMVDNPAYKGEWKAKQIPNPNFFEDDHPADVFPIGGIGIEVWTTNPGFRFDNIVIAHELAPVFEYADKTFIPKQKAESVLVEKQEDGKQAEEVFDWKSLESWKTHALIHFNHIKKLGLAHYGNILQLKEENPLPFAVASTIALCSVVVWIVVFGKDFLLPSSASKKKAVPLAKTTATSTPAVTEEKKETVKTEEVTGEASQGAEQTKEPVKDVAGAGAGEEGDGDELTDNGAGTVPNKQAIRPKKTPKLHP